MDRIPKTFLHPECVKIGEREYGLNTDFSVWIEIEQLLLYDTGSACERFAKIVSLAFCELPPEPELAMDGILWFYSLGKVPDEKKKAAVGVPSFDIKNDFEYIYASFFSEYGIDLANVQMHWWKFRTLLECLGEHSKFSQIVSFRCIDTEKIKDKDVRAFYRKMKNKYRLADRRSEEEKENDLALEIGKLF